MILAHAGNRIDGDDRPEPRFPAAQVGEVTTHIARALAELRPSSVVSAPANGADLIILTEAQRLGIAIHVVLPLPIEDFRETSVDASDPQWVDRYRAVLDFAGSSPGSTLESVDLGGDPQWHLRANGLILERAATIAGDDETVIALTVRPTEGESPPSATDDFARRAVEAGLTVLTLDPRPGRTRALVLR